MYLIRDFVYTTHMGTAWVECWRCDECGHRWIKGETWPTHCASSKCRKRTWNKLGTIMDQAAAMAPVGAVAVELQSPLGNVVDRRELQDICDGKTKPTEEPAEVCGFKAYSAEDGETYTCGLPVHGIKIKHGNWRRV